MAGPFLAWPEGQYFVYNYVGFFYFLYLNGMERILEEF